MGGLLNSDLECEKHPVPGVDSPHSIRLSGRRCPHRSANRAASSRDPQNVDLIIYEAVSNPLSHPDAKSEIREKNTHTEMLL